MYKLVKEGAIQTWVAPFCVDSVSVSVGFSEKVYG